MTLAIRVNPWLMQSESIHDSGNTDFVHTYISQPWEDHDSGNSEFNHESCGPWANPRLSQSRVNAWLWLFWNNYDSGQFWVKPLLWQSESIHATSNPELTHDSGNNELVNKFGNHEWTHDSFVLI